MKKNRARPGEDSSILYLTLSIFLVIFGIAAWAGYDIVREFNNEEMPKFLGAAFGAFFGAGVATMLFTLARQTDRIARNRDLAKLEKAYWQDVWSMLPDVYDEWIYWRARSNSPHTPKLRPNSGDLIVEHLRSPFYEANLAALPRLDLKAQHLLVMFHDLLRVSRERLMQLIPLVVASEKPTFRHQAADDHGLEMLEEKLTKEQRDKRILQLTATIVWLLESVLLHGWAAQEHLDQGGLWHSDFRELGDLRLTTAKTDWIGGLKGLVASKKNEIHSRDDVH